MTGDTTTWITLNLKLRAYLLFREDHPLSIPYFEKKDEGYYQFHGPVNNFDGIGRFVLGLMDEIVIVEPREFREFVSERIGRRTV